MISVKSLLLSREIKIAAKRGTNEAAEQIGSIGRKHKSHAGQAIEALQEFNTDVAANGIRDIGIRHKSYTGQAIDALQNIGTDKAVENIAWIAQQHKEQSLHGFGAMLERVEANLPESGQDILGKTVTNAIVQMRGRFTADTDETREVLSQTFRQAEKEGKSHKDVTDDLARLLEYSRKLVPESVPSREEVARQRLVGTPNVPGK